MSFPRRKEEAKMSTRIGKWLYYNAGKLAVENGFQNFGPVEVKVAYEKRFNFKSGFKEHQLPTLIKCRYGTVVWKIPDTDMLSRKPCDFLVYTRSMSAVIIYWMSGIHKKMFYVIDPEKIWNMQKHGKKSITEREAADACFKIGVLQS